MIHHRGIVNFVHAQGHLMDVTPESCILHTLSPCFDGALSEALLALGHGAKLVVANRETVLDPRLLAALIEKEQVSLGKFPPALLAMLQPGDVPSMKTVSSAADRLTGELAQQWMTGRRFFNGYGPTETSVGATMVELHPPPSARPPIGRPMPNYRVYVLDATGGRCPVGVAGEIYVGGPGVGRGYWKRPELTATSFLKDPFNNEEQAVMYRTGDLGRWNRAGLLEFLGRTDGQIKLRGYRIETGEIAARLEQLDDVEQAVVALREDAAGNPRLTAYVVPRVDPEQQQSAQRSAENRHVENWRELFDETHRLAPPVLDAELNITGLDQQFHWPPNTRGRNATVGRFGGRSRFGYEAVSSVGDRLRDGHDSVSRCSALRTLLGNGLVGGLAEQVRRAVETRHDLRDGVTLRRSDADQPLEGDDAFDTVVMNSVIQYFPSIDYLLRTLEHAVATVPAGGRVFLGDVRRLGLQRVWQPPLKRLGPTPQPLRNTCAGGSRPPQARRGTARGARLLCRVRTTTSAVVAGRNPTTYDRRRQRVDSLPLRRRAARAG